MLLCLVCIYMRVWLKERAQCSPQMFQVLAYHLGALLCLGKDERALKHGLDEVANALGAPRGGG